MACDEKGCLDRSVEVGGRFLGCVRMGELLHRADDRRHPPATLNYPLNPSPQTGGPIPCCRGYLVECRSKKMRAVADVPNGDIDLIRNPSGQPTHRLQFPRQSKFNFSLLTKACLLVQLGNGLS